MSDSFLKKLFCGKSIKAFRKCYFRNVILYFLTKKITCVNDIGAYFTEYVLDVISCEIILLTYFEIRGFECHWGLS